jgi:hypothetical protein
MIHEQTNMPTRATTGDVWLGPKGEFKRVLSRGGAWENVNLGSKHPDEVSHEQDQLQRPEAEQRVESPEVPAGAGESTPGNGDDGEAAKSTENREENPGLSDGVALNSTAHPGDPFAEGDGEFNSGEAPTLVGFSQEASGGPAEGEGVDGDPPAML